MRILIAEDDTPYRRHLEALLHRWGHETIVVSDGIQAWAALHKQNRPSIAILDWVMPGMDGLRVCQNLRGESSQAGYVYVLILTARGQRKDILQAFEAGADDFVPKPFEPDELRARLQVGRRILDLEAKLTASLDALKVEATHDSLTGALNRKAIFEMLDQELGRSQRDGGSVATLLVDLDNFKLINDRYGHLVGDAVLREFVRRVKAALRSYDSVGRYGGEEFLIVLPKCGMANAIRSGNRILASLAATPFGDGHAGIEVRASAGIAATDGDPGRDLDDLLHEADAALYRAKSGGRNRVAIEAKQALRSAS